jgi:hypothetical protein
MGPQNISRQPHRTQEERNRPRRSDGGAVCEGIQGWSRLSGMVDSESTDNRRSPDTEIQVAAAAITAAISPPLGIAVAAGSALRSSRVREALRKGTVNALAGAMQLGDQLTAAAAARAGETPSEPPSAEPVQNGQVSTTVPQS